MRPCSSASTMPVMPWPAGPTATTPSGPIRPSDTKPRRSLPPNSPQWAISFAHMNRCADRPLLRRRNRAKFNKGLWSQPDGHRGSQHDLWRNSTPKPCFNRVPGAREWLRRKQLFARDGNLGSPVGASAGEIRWKGSIGKQSIDLCQRGQSGWCRSVELGGIANQEHLARLPNDRL